MFPALESIESSDESVKDVISPYISFVSLNLEVFDIFFEQDGPRCTPRIGDYIGTMSSLHIN